MAMKLRGSSSSSGAAGPALQGFRRAAPGLSVQPPAASEFRASRCFKIEYNQSGEDDQDDVAMTKWIFSIPSCRDVETLFTQAREAQLFRGMGIELDFDHGPRSKVAPVRLRRVGPERAAEAVRSASLSTVPCGRSAVRVEAGARNLELGCARVALAASGQEHIEDCKSAYLSFELNLIKGSSARDTYIATLKSTSAEMFKRNTAMELSRKSLSSMCKATSETLKEQCKSVTELLDHYPSKITGDKEIHFGDLTEVLAADAYMEAIEVSDRTNVCVDWLSKRLDKAGRVLVLASAATSVAQVCYDEHPDVAGVLAAAEYIGAAVLGQAVDGNIAYGAGIAGLGALPVLGLCCTALIGLAFGAKPHFKKSYDVFAQPVFAEHRRHRKKLFLDKGMTGFVEHNPKGLSGATVGGMLGNVILQSGSLPIMGGAAFGWLDATQMSWRAPTASSETSRAAHGPSSEVLAFPPRQRSAFTLTPLDDTGRRLLLFGGRSGPPGGGHCLGDVHVLETDVAAGQAAMARPPDAGSSDSEPEEIFFASDYRAFCQAAPRAPARGRDGRLEQRAVPRQGCHKQESASEDGSPAWTTPAHEWQHPPSFLCPISRQCMHDPVVLPDGHTYERQHIQRWLSHSSTSPVTRQELIGTNLYPNHALRNAIDEYFNELFCVHRQTIRQTIRRRGTRDLAANARLLRTVDALMECSLLVNADHSVEHILRHIMNEAKMLVGAEAASVFLVDGSRQELYSSVNSTGVELRIPFGAGIAGHVAMTGDTVIIDDAYADARFNKTIDRKTGFRTRTVLCAPLKARKGGVIGVVQLINKTHSSETTSRGNVRGASSASRPESAVGRLRSGRSFVKALDPDQGSRFTADDSHFLEVFASQAATAVVNSDTFGELNQPHLQTEHSDLPPERLAQEAEADRLEAEPVKAQPSCKKGGQAPRISQEATTLLEQSLDGWDLDVATLASLTDGRPLSSLGCFLFDRLGLVARFGLDSEKVSQFFLELERGYDDAVQYHNPRIPRGLRAAPDPRRAAQWVARAESRGGAAERPGCGRSGRSARGHGVPAGRRLPRLRAPRLHERLPGAHGPRARSALQRQPGEREPPRGRRVRAAAAPGARLPGRAAAGGAAPPPRPLPAAGPRHRHVLRQEHARGLRSRPGQGRQRTGGHAAGWRLPGGSRGRRLRAPHARGRGAVLLLQLALKGADLGHLTLGLAAHLRFVGCLEQEFFAQGDKEKALGMPASFLMDRDKPGASSSQVGFFELVALPLFRVLDRACPSLRPMLAGAERNCLYWKSVQGDARASIVGDRPEVGVSQRGAPGPYGQRPLVSWARQRGGFSSNSPEL
ncbi:unnamed protein product [Prorocentrum cordatum]|uniref:RING-type E3 ubiquitin transferase n=1 Tax=Prorocentrum cordatum TaxID=2364126 RepID=A0ABN9RGN3_9DINO|nr:unnamed protein product [Polarella glacialis]